jgi:hypothetical protein
MAFAPTPPALLIDRELPPVPGSYPSNGPSRNSGPGVSSPVEVDEQKEGVQDSLPSLMRSNLHKLSTMNLGTTMDSGIESRRNTIGLDSLDSREGSEDGHGHGHMGSSKLGVDSDSRRNRKSSRDSSVEVRSSAISRESAQRLICLCVDL